tara:strand:- start:184 stop:882 length:699 start_codon:yes stop_codon:yes gene_type:complete
VSEPQTIVSWNIHGLPLFLTSNITKNIVKKIINFNSDIVCIQECFSDILLDKIKKETCTIYPYLITGSLKKKFVLGENSGLVILSKYPINFQLFHNYKSSSGCDSLSNKGYLIVKIGKLNIVNTHLQSDELNIFGNTEKIIEAQLEELKQYLPCENTILCGDFNTQKLDDYINITKNNKRNTLNSLYFRNPQICDYIVSNDKNYQLRTTVIDLFNNPSDHKPVKALILKNQT